jgi:Domain of unknown function (DUF4253)
MPRRQELPALTPDEQELVRRIGFDAPVLQFLKSHLLSDFQQLTVQGFDAKGFPVDVPVPGLTFATYQRRAELLVRDLRQPLGKRSHLIFFSELADLDRPATVAVIRGSDPYDILRTMRTADINGDKTTDDVIAHLKVWEQRYPFNIWGANHDWVLAKFRKMPDDRLAFAREVIAFAPDNYAQGDWDNEEHYARAMRRERGFHLWWD